MAPSTNRARIMVRTKSIVATIQGDGPLLRVVIAHLVTSPFVLEAPTVSVSGTTLVKRKTAI